MTRLLACSILAVSTLAVLSASQQPPIFRGTTDTVRVFVTVIDDNERLVTTVTRDQFEVRDNGRPQPLTLFDNTPQPIQLVVMLDVSGSMQGNLSLLRAACEQLFSRLGPNDVARVGSFGREIAISPASFTQDVAQLVGALPVTIERNAPTPLWRALDEAMSAFDASDTRRVVLVLSDGGDSGPTFGKRFMSQLDIIERARRDNVMIYAIGLHGRIQPRLPGESLQAAMVASLPDPGLGRAALESGGGYLEIRPRDDLGAAFARVADELHSQYVLGFAPPERDGKSHKIEVRVSAKGLKPRARKTYEAPAVAKPAPAR